jgi:hypothetical protein
MQITSDNVHIFFYRVQCKLRLACLMQSVCFIRFVRCKLPQLFNSWQLVCSTSFFVINIIFFIMLVLSLIVFPLWWRVAHYKNLLVLVLYYRFIYLRVFFCQGCLIVCDTELSTVAMVFSCQRHSETSDPPRMSARYTRF